MSEYIEGSGFNKAIEIYNGTDSAVDLAAGLYTLELYSNGAATPSKTAALTGTVAAGDVLVLAHPSADAAILAQADVIDIRQQRHQLQRGRQCGSAQERQCH